MATTYYKLLSPDQPELGLSLAATSDEATSPSSSSSSSDDDSLDLALLKIGNKQQRAKNKRQVRRKPRSRRAVMGNLSNFEGGESYEELVGSAKKRRQLLKLIGLFVVAVLVVGAIVLAVFLVTKDDAFDEDAREPIELSDILEGAFSAKRFNGTWIDDNSYQFWDASGNLRVNNVKLKTSDVIAWRNQTEVVQASSHEFSYDKSFILIASQILKLFRHSSLAYWDIYDVQTQRLLPIMFNGSRQPLQFAKFSPADNSLVFVHDNNIYYKKSPTEAGEIQLTKDGSLLGGIFNGVPDWVYEEEIFSSNSALWFSPDGKKLAFMRFDDSNVRAMHLPIYGGPGVPEYQYPQTLQVHYPKAASKNPEVKLFTVDLADSATAAASIKEIPVPTRFVNSHIDHIISSVSWANAENLVAVFMNRVQNQADIRKCTIGTGGIEPACTDIQKLDVTGGWVEFYTAPFYNKDGSEMIFINSESGFHHVVALNINKGERMARTSGNFVVDQILGVSKENNLIFFTANTEEDVKVRHVYVIKNEVGAKMMCLTCRQEGHFGTHSYFDADLSTDGSHIAVSAEGPEVPKHAIASIDLEKLELKDVQVLETNVELNNVIHGKKFPKVIYDKIRLDNGSTSQVKMVVPSDYDPTMKYPMLVDVYGGPNSVSVTNRWGVDWGTYLVSAKDFIYVRIDGRGSGNKGDENLFSLYRKLGTVEVEDQIETAHKLQQRYKYIDEKNSAIWGWSYGGYVSGMSLAKDTEGVFKCGVSVAPVTDWTLYDSIYTERYMGLPTIDDNHDAYESAQLMKYVDNFKTNNKSYMLVHGTLDDNVHFQQGMMLARALELKDIMFREVTYPDEDHSLARVRKHLYHTLEHFFTECFHS